MASRAARLLPHADVLMSDARPSERVVGLTEDRIEELLLAGAIVDGGGRA